ncbi:MAG: SagB/ThcOx family dehydrogenase [Desulfobacteraceae bacterium]|nr:SagB/ThcOx family dehydrogenase [Desulfobacteraceae bacterium]
MPELTAALGHRYWAETKLERGGREARRPLIEPAAAGKSYPQARKVPLLHDLDLLDKPFGHLLRERRSHRRYGEELLTGRELAMLLWAAQGVTARAGSALLRTAPSAGALHPLETYVAVEKVDQLERGLYHLDVGRFELSWLSGAPLGRELAHAALEQSFLAQAAAIFLWSALFRRNMAKYGHRGLRYILLDAGHLCQNLLLAAQAMGLAACPVAAFYDDEVNDLLGLDGDEEAVLYLAAVGRRKE